MVPFLATDLDRMMRQIHGLFMKRDVNEANTPYLLSQVDVSKKENDFPIDSLDLGRAATSELARLGVLAVAKKLQFKKHCKKVLIKLSEKLTETSLLNYTAVQNATSFDLRQMINHEIVCITRVKKLIQRLDLNILTSTESDNATRNTSYLFRRRYIKTKIILVLLIR